MSNLIELEGAIRCTGENERWQILAQILPTADPEILMAISDHLEDDSPSVCRVAADALIRCGNLQAAAAAGAHLFSSAQQERAGAFSVLVGIGQPALPVIYHFLAESDPALRKSACEALAKIHCQSSVEPLAPVLQDPDPVVAAAAAEALAELGSEAAVPVLIASLRNPSIWVRIPVISALGVLGGKQALAALLDLPDPTNEYEVGSLIEAIGIAGQADPESAFPYLAEKFLSPTTYLQETTLAALSSLVSRKVSIPFDIQEQLICAIESKIDYQASGFRYRLATCLGSMKNQRGWPLLEYLANDPDSHVRKKAQSGLIRLGYYSTKQLCEIACQQSYCVEIRVLALRRLNDVLGLRRGDIEEIIDPIVGLAQPGCDEAVRAAALCFLSRKAPELGYPLVVQALTVKDGSSSDDFLAELAAHPIQYLLAFMIKGCQDPKVCLKLLALLDTKEKIRAIAEIEDGQALLISCMGNDHWQIRAKTVQILGSVPAHWALQLIHHACMDYDLQVRTEAIEIVRRRLKIEGD
jgi:HEAT repeat protein